ncbi:hypothetical protein ACFE04_015941 [Oxalis oulophora]
MLKEVETLMLNRVVMGKADKFTLKEMFPRDTATPSAPPPSQSTNDSSHPNTGSSSHTWRITSQDSIHHISIITHVFLVEATYIRGRLSLASPDKKGPSKLLAQVIDMEEARKKAALERDMAINTAEANLWLS